MTHITSPANSERLKNDQDHLLSTLNHAYGRRYWLHVGKITVLKYALRIRPIFSFWLKRMFDILVSSLLLILLAPVFLVLTILIKLDGGPAFYCQWRIGRYGKEFKFWKFRSMIVDADKLKANLADQNEMEGGVIFKMKNDPRITPIGRFIRRTSLDELPQLWNVLTGEMSLVGPRPPLPEEARQYTARERKRLDTKQGITCIWQVSGRSEICFSDQVDLDLQYIQEESLWNDIKLLLKTLPAVISGRGAS